MYDSHSVFHESYYEHSCHLVSEKDVIHTRIRGNSLGDNLRRWWYNLFLLSYDDVRCRMFYTSSQTMRIERSRQYRFYRDRIHPLSKFRSFWDGFISIVILLNRTIVNHSMSIIFGDFSMAVYIIAILLEFIIIFDIYINFKTGYIDTDNRCIILNSKRGMIRYSSTKLFLHCLSSLPVQTILFIRYGSNISCILCMSNRFVCTLRMISALGLYRLYVSSTCWSRERRSFNVTYVYKFIRICVLGFMTLFQYYDLINTVSLFIIISTQTIEETSYYAVAIRYRYWRNTKGTNYTEFVMGLVANVVRSLFVFGFGYVSSATHYMDKVYCLIGCFIIFVFFIWGFMEAFVVVNRWFYSDDAMTYHMERAIAMMRCSHISDQVSSKVLDYYYFNLSRLVVTEKVNDLYQFLPTSITKEIMLNAYRHLFQRITHFQDWPSKIIDDLMPLLKEEVYLIDDIVCDAWAEGSGLVIVVTGVLAVYDQNRQETGHLIDGDYFGLLSLVTDREINSSYVVAISQCKVLILNKNEFRHFMRRAPQLFFVLRSNLRSRKTNDRKLSVSGSLSVHSMSSTD